MSDISPNLNLPFLLSSQAQKHLILNQSLLTIDNLLMLSVISNELSSPPTNPQEGDRYIVANNASGAWTGKEHQIACYNNLGWHFIEPKNGFLAYLSSGNKILCFRGNIWDKLPLPEESFQNLSRLGLATQSDANNPLSAKLNSALLSAKYAAESGNGDIRLKLNKEAASNISSILFQTNWSGFAEIGLCGDNNLSFKVSADGSEWKSSINLDKSTGRAGILGLDLPATTTGNNDFVRLGTVRFLHTKKATGTDGYNLFIGEEAGNFTMSYSSAASDASQNVGVGYLSLNSLSYGKRNTAIGSQAAKSLTSGQYNTAIGYAAIHGNTTGSNNTAIGYEALRYKIDGAINDTFGGCSGIGAGVKVSGSNQIQLGATGTTVYAYGAVQDRSDMRDKADIRDTILGLEFINALHPVDYRWDMRDDYFTRQTEIDENGNEIETIQSIPKDGSKKRNRFHHGLIAQEVKAACVAAGVDFGGYQDHSMGGGNDVLSIGYTELIAPLIKAVQELSIKVAQLDSNQIN